MQYQQGRHPLYSFTANTARLSTGHFTPVFYIRQSLKAWCHCLRIPRLKARKRGIFGFVQHILHERDGLKWLPHYSDVQGQLQSAEGLDSLMLNEEAALSSFTILS